ncbi:MAG: two-component regulator propeller domain-containing protein [Bacteroidota bacterium]
MFSQELYFDHIGPEDGFPSSTVLCLLQDRQGFIWIGTTDGLFRYDGNMFKEFRSSPNDTLSLSNNYIKVLKEDQKGNIWIGSNLGLNCYDPEKENFKRYFNTSEKHFEASNNIHSITEDKNGFIWTGTYYGLYRLNIFTNETLQFLPDVENPNSINHEVVWQVFESQEKELWVGTNNGLCFYKNDGSFQFEQFLPDPQDPNGLKTGKVWDFVQQPNGTLWLGSDNGFYRVDKDKEKVSFQRFHHAPENENSLSYNFVENIIAEGDNKIWVCTWSGGLNEIIIENGKPVKYIHHRHDPQKEHSIRIDQVKDYLKDRNGNIWVANASGLDKHAPSQRKFSNIWPNELNVNALSDPIIKAVIKDSNGNYWIGTRNGLNFILKEDFEKKEFNFINFYHQKNNPKSLSHNNIFGLYEDRLGYLWISTYRGLNYVKIKNKNIDTALQFNHIYHEDGLPHNYILNVLETTSGEYWLITYGGLGLMEFNPMDNQSPRVQLFEMDEKRNDALINSSLRIGAQDKYGNYWFGTFNGLSKYSNKNGRQYFENYLNKMHDSTSLSDNNINDMLLDKKDRLWIATRKGLNLVKQNSANEMATFINYGIKDGFNNDVIQSIEEDQNGKLWLGTNRGLVHFDPDATKNKVLSTYYKSDGLISDAQIFRASFADPNGTLFFGSPGGLNYFNLSDLIINHDPPKVVITGLKLMNQPVQISERKNSILKKSISISKKIKLTHKHTILTLEFAAMDFSVPDKNKYRFKLENFNDQWIDNGYNNSVTFTNLSAGEYVFKVKGSNGDGIWSEEPTVLEIKILPPPWLTWWAYILYALAIGGALYYFIKFRIKQKLKKVEENARIEKARFEERELLRKQNAADFHDELGHRLTKISLFLELAERQLNNGNNTNKYLAKIKTQTVGLSSGIRDLIWTLDPKSDSLFQTLIRIREFGDKLFEHSTINFNSTGMLGEHEKIQLDPLVRKHLLMITKEAMNNCLKYSNAKNCWFNIDIKKDLANLIIEDDGDGFDINKIKRGYGLKNMQARAVKINAELTIHSLTSKGTRISLSLKLPHMG